MSRKRIADQQPAVSNEGAAAAAAKAPVKANAPASNADRAPCVSANAVTHRHKKNAAIENPEAPAAATMTQTVSEPPTREEIAIRAYLLSESRGFMGGSMEQDWLDAERQLLAERAAK